VLDGWTLTAALLARTQRIEIGSIRLVHHWNAAKLAQAIASLDRIAPGRLRFLCSIGGQPADRRFGLAFPDPAERIAWLDETLTALRALWRGETVTCRGRYVQLEGARVRPTVAVPVEIAARGPRLLRLVAAHADRWDVNLPPLPERVAEAAQQLAAACRQQGREPDEIERSMWIFTRPGGPPGDPALRREFRRFNPWFRELADAEVDRAIVAGDASACREQLARLGEELRLTLPVADLSGLDHDATRHAVKRMAPR
jgi:alkanesulfonate monooxygenase SsuD/methylene tetrahydromethanopterin reductase-like flavin-dependent oxidoreductase (luciferase family)